MGSYVLTETERQRIHAQIYRMKRFMEERTDDPVTFADVQALVDELVAVMDDIGVPGVSVTTTEGEVE